MIEHQPSPNPAKRILTGAVTKEELEQVMPMHEITRVMQACLPAHAKISCGAKRAIQECVFGFISSVTNIACEQCQQEQRQMMTGDDLLTALRRLSLNEYAEPLGAYLDHVRAMEVMEILPDSGEDLPPLGTTSGSCGTYDTDESDVEGGDLESFP